MSLAVKVTRGRVPWAAGVASDDPMRELVVHPPLKHKACKRCGHREACREHDRTTGHVMCEVLSYTDLWCAERDGLLNETVWWQVLPGTYTADDVVRALGNGHGRPNRS